MIPEILNKTFRKTTNVSLHEEKIFNNVPNNIKKELTKNTFKISLTTILLEKIYNSLMEYLIDNKQTSNQL